MAQSASKVCPYGPKCAHLVPFLPTLDALLATWGLPLHFYAFLLGFREQLCISIKNSWENYKIQQIALKQ